MHALQGEDALRELFRIIARQIGAFDKNEAACCGVSTAQCRAILELGYRDEATSLVDLADRLGVDKSAMSRTVDLLVRARLAERREDGQNRRFVSIRLTERGKDVFFQRKESMDAYLKEVLDAIPEDKRGQAEESIHLLAAAIDRVKCC